jgi:hypothetical protein
MAAAASNPTRSGPSFEQERAAPIKTIPISGYLNIFFIIFKIN